MHCVYLGVSCIFEVVFALSSNASKGFTQFWPTIITLLAATGGIYTLSLALTEID